jgi:hypothetical protein
MTLEYYKMKKNIRGVKEKGYSDDPASFNLDLLLKRLHDEVKELDASLDWLLRIHPIERANYLYEFDQLEAVKKECADVSNFTDFIFEKMVQLEKLKYLDEIKKLQCVGVEVAAEVKNDEK